MKYLIKLLFNILFVFLFIIIECNAHSLINNNSGFGSGFSHPILGLDHFLAMFGVGIWGAQMGGRSIWSLPLSFPIIMCVGAIISIINIVLFSYVEEVIALSVIIIGLLILLKWKINEFIAILIISVFAIYHGYAHGFELPRANDPTSFIIGFVLSTGLIHLLGILVGYMLGKIYNGKISRLLGGIISLLGIYFLFSFLI